MIMQSTTSKYYAAKTQSPGMFITLARWEPPTGMVHVEVGEA